MSHKPFGQTRSKPSHAKQKLSAKSYFIMQRIVFSNLLIKHAWLGVGRLARGGRYLARPVDES